MTKRPVGIASGRYVGVIVSVIIVAVPVWSVIVASPQRPCDATFDDPQGPMLLIIGGAVK